MSMSLMTALIKVFPHGNIIVCSTSHTLVSRNSTAEAMWGNLQISAFINIKPAMFNFHTKSPAGFTLEVMLKWWQLPQIYRICHRQSSQRISCCGFMMNVCLWFYLAVEK